MILGTTLKTAKMRLETWKKQVFAIKIPEGEMTFSKKKIIKKNGQGIIQLK